MKASNTTQGIDNVSTVLSTGLDHLYKTIFDFAPDVIVVTNEQGKILLVNKMVKKVLGYEIGELIGKEVEVLIPSNLAGKHQAHRRSFVENPHFREMGGGLDLKVLKKDQTKISAEISLSYFETGNERLVLAAIRDITEKRQMAQKLEHVLADLQSKNEELEKFAYIASHDLQEPLRTVSSFVSLLQDQYKGMLAPDADEYIQFIVSATARMKNLIKGLLDYSKTGSDHSMQRVDVMKVLKTLTKDMEASIRACGAIITFNELPVITANDLGITQVFQNLIANALKYRKTDINPIIEISARRGDHEWIFAVKDNGIGVDQKFVKKIFEIFQRLHSHKEYEGVGIGLAHCKKIIDMHNGKIGWSLAQTTEVPFCLLYPT